MKKYVLISVLFLVVIAARAERTSNKIFSHKNTDSGIGFKTTATSDTLGFAPFLSGSRAIYKDQVGGYVAGTNVFNDRAKAQEYDDSTASVVEKVLIWFAVKKFNSGDSLHSFVTVNVYKLDSVGYGSSATTRACPGTIVASSKLLVKDIDTVFNHLTTVNFDFPNFATTTGNFAVGIAMDSVNVMDTIAVYTSDTSNAHGTQQSWEKESDGLWYTLKRSWPLDVDLAIFPVINKNTIGIAKINNTSFLSASNQPNPANESSTILYELSAQSFVNIDIYDVTGKLIFTQNLLNQIAGKHNFTLDTRNFSSGIYCYTLHSESNSTSNKLVIIH